MKIIHSTKNKLINTVFFKNISYSAQGVQTSSLALLSSNISLNLCGGPTGTIFSAKPLKLSELHHGIT